MENGWQSVEIPTQASDACLPGAQAPRMVTAANRPNTRSFGETGFLVKSLVSWVHEIETPLTAHLGPVPCFGGTGGFVRNGRTARIHDCPGETG